MLTYAIGEMRVRYDEFISGPPRYVAERDTATKTIHVLAPARYSTAARFQQSAGRMKRQPIFSRKFNELVFKMPDDEFR